MFNEFGLRALDLISRLSGRPRVHRSASIIERLGESKILLYDGSHGLYRGVMKNRTPVGVLFFRPVCPEGTPEMGAARELVEGYGEVYYLIRACR